MHHGGCALAEDFLRIRHPDRAGCAILDVRIPDLSGLQLQQQLAEQTPGMPIIFHSAHVNVSLVVRAIQSGAVNFLQKPADEQDLWDAIQHALQIDRERRRAQAAEAGRFQQKLEQLTEKEIEVLELLSTDKSTRAIARELQISVRTVEFRRARMLKRLGFTTPLQLSHFAIRAFDNKGPTVPVRVGCAPHDGNMNGAVVRRRKHPTEKLNCA